jgi:ABC-type dipeptide/oligopeptide/nickel transport system permease subunit
VTAVAEQLTETADASVGRVRSAGPWRDALGRVLRQRNAQIGLVILSFLALVAILAPVLAPFDPESPLIGKEPNIDSLAPPCIHALGCPAELPQHLMGTDSNFRDVFSRVVFGARTSLVIGFVTVGFAIVVGALIGAVAGYAGGWSDNLGMRVMDVLLVFPAFLLAILIVTVMGRGLTNAMLAIAVVSIPIYARIMRASVLTVREQDFVSAARALGESSIGILFRRVLPNALTPIIVAGTLGIGSAVLEVAALAFIGLTGDPRLPEWGSMIGIERNRALVAPHVLFFPGLALVLTVLAFNLLGDGIRDALDPRLHR